MKDPRLSKVETQTHLLNLNSRTYLIEDEEDRRDLITEAAWRTVSTDSNDCDFEEEDEEVAWNITEEECMFDCLSPPISIG